MVNSVADQYLFRVGGATQIPGVRHFSGSLAFRAEGLRRYDIFGRSDGFRRPGYELYLEPGFAYVYKGQSLSFNMPIGLYRNRLPDPVHRRARRRDVPRLRLPRQLLSPLRQGHQQAAGTAAEAGDSIAAGGKQQLDS